jgi:hypothetical protein
MRKPLAILLMLPFILQAQINPNTPGYDQMKRDGLIPIPNHQVITPEVINEMNEFDAGRSEGFFIPLDATFTQSMLPNDDGSVGPISLGFTFCFYGTDYTEVYINNNGNLSFDESYSSYSPIGFPSSEYIMIAPFWGDVDTRAQGSIGTGLVWHKLEAGRLTVIYDHVGYFSYQTDKLNTFQVIITDGNDPLIGIGNNVAFAYEEMEWTTGSASGGTNGFGGSPATVGVNKGDGVNYALVGRFDAPGTCYDGPFGDNDCVSYLNNKRYVFDACQDEVFITDPRCDGIVSLVGEFNNWGWQPDLILTQNPNNPSIWTGMVTVNIGMNLYDEPDIISVKFRLNQDWAINWGSMDFPSGVGYQDGPNILIPVNADGTSDTYAITFNCSTGEYSFVPVELIPISNWALYLGILLMITFVVIRFRRMI